MQTRATTNAPLAANQSYYSPWFDLSGTGDLPVLDVSVLSDQAGTYQVLESDNPTDAGQTTIAGGGVAQAGVPADMTFSPRKRFCQVAYLNGATPQASFLLTVREYSPAVGYTDSRMLDLILREIRIQNLLLMQMREPYGSTVNIRPSLDQIET